MQECTGDNAELSYCERIALRMYRSISRGRPMRWSNSMEVTSSRSQHGLRMSFSYVPVCLTPIKPKTQILMIQHVYLKSNEPSDR